MNTLENDFFFLRGLKYQLKRLFNLKEKRGSLKIKNKVQDIHRKLRMLFYVLIFDLNRYLKVNENIGKKTCRRKRFRTGKVIDIKNERDLVKYFRDCIAHPDLLSQDDSKGDSDFPDNQNEISPRRIVGIPNFPWEMDFCIGQNENKNIRYAYFEYGDNKIYIHQIESLLKEIKISFGNSNVHI